MEMIEADPERLSVTDLASAVGVSVRGLQEGFVRHVGMSPMTYLRDVRLARAHRDLVAADPELITVASAARPWGFSHLGRFAASYQKKYGVLPSETLDATSPRTRPKRWRRLPRVRARTGRRQRFARTLRLTLTLTSERAANQAGRHSSRR